MSSVLGRAGKAAKGEKMEWQGQQVDYRYRFKRETLFNSIEALIPAELESCLRAIVSDETAYERKKTRDANKNSQRQTKGVAEKRRRGVEMLKQGCSVEEIMSVTGAGRSTVFRWKQREFWKVSFLTPCIALPPAYDLEFKVIGVWGYKGYRVMTLKTFEIQSISRREPGT